MSEFWKLAGFMLALLLVTGALYQIVPRFPWASLMVGVWLATFLIRARLRKRSGRQSTDV